MMNCLGVFDGFRMDLEYPNTWMFELNKLDCAASQLAIHSGACIKSLNMFTKPTIQRHYGSEQSIHCQWDQAPEFGITPVTSAIRIHKLYTVYTANLKQTEKKGRYI